jgi:NADH-quinone oxidoreductase subunit G
MKDAACAVPRRREAGVPMLGADEIDIPEGAFVVYQGSHGDRGAHRADVILPARPIPSSRGLFVNMEGRPQLALPRRLPAGRGEGGLGDPAGAVGASWAQTLPFDSLAALRGQLYEAHPHLAGYRRDRAGQRMAARREPAGAMGGRRLSPAATTRPLPDQPDRCAPPPERDVMAELSRLAAFEAQPMARNERHAPADRTR